MARTTTTLSSPLSLLFRYGKMEEDWTDSLPKFLPSWHGCVPNYYLQRKKLHRFVQDRIPDYACTGIDITADENGSKCEVSKYGIDQVHFGAQVCALPFSSCDKTYLLQDPCLKHINKQRKEFKEFSMKIHSTRIALNYKKFVPLREDLLSSRKLIQKMCLSGEFEKINLSQNIVKIADVFPQTVQVDQTNYDYSGGCLAALNKDNENPILLHPVGSKLNKLAVTPLIQTNESNCVFKSDETICTTVKLKGGCIQQIKSTFDGYCYVKQGARCHLVNLTQLPEIHHSECTNKNVIKNISPSPYIPVEFVSIHEDGKITLNDVEESIAVWETNNFCFSNKWIDERSPLSCDFGSHPRSILYLDNKEVHALDLRLKQKNRTSIFSCHHSSCFTDESLLALKRLSVNPFQHLVLSSHHLFLCDERYSSKPVLIWNHLLNGPPLYCDIATYDTTPDSNDVVILLGTQDTQELVSFAVKTRQSQLQTVSLTPPLSLSSVTDWADSLRFHGQYIEDSVINRISNPLAGVCAVPHYNNPAFTAFQITSVGDVFFQNFEKGSHPKAERTYRVDMGCVLTPPEKILPHLSHFMNDPDIFESVDDDPAVCNLQRINIDIKDILKAPTEISEWCVMCKSLIPNCDEKIVVSDVCPSCGLDQLQSDQLQNGHKELDLLIGPYRESTDIQCLDNVEELSQFTDHYSRKILDLWISTEDASGQNICETPPWEYQSDFSLPALSPASNTSYSAFSMPFKNLSTFSQLDDSNFLTQPSSQNLFENETIPEIQESMYTQETMEELIPPSQDVRPKIGETIRRPKKSKAFSKLNTSSAGF